MVCYGAMSATAFPLPFGMVPDSAWFGATQEERCALSAERQIRFDTPPMFLWQTMSDDGRHGMNLASALQAMGAIRTAYLSGGGARACAGGRENDLDSTVETVSRWPELCLGWLNENGL